MINNQERWQQSDLGAEKKKISAKHAELLLATDPKKHHRGRFLFRQVEGGKTMLERFESHLQEEKR